MKYIEGFRNGQAGRALGARILETAAAFKDRTVNLMEVCGSHTMAISRYGIRQMLPANINLISGPGCPVCVTDVGYVDAAIELARQGHIICTFGDMVRVPGTSGHLAGARSDGADIRVCYSPSQAVTFAKENPAREVIFLAIGFETTMAPVTTLIKTAEEQKIDNLTLLTAFKLVPPALDALIADPEVNVDAFICPAHVSAIIGADAYKPYVEKGVPCVVCGFEPLDILYGVDNLASQFARGEVALVNQYSRVVGPGGNKAALALFDHYLETTDPAWRGIGVIPQSGLKIKKAFSRFDASVKFQVSTTGGKSRPGCRCGDVLKGKIAPDACALFQKVCTPENPIGPCMVSSEGSCAAYYKYER